MLSTIIFAVFISALIIWFVVRSAFEDLEQDF